MAKDSIAIISLVWPWSRQHSAFLASEPVCMRVLCMCMRVCGLQLEIVKLIRVFGNPQYATIIYSVQ